MRGRPVSTALAIAVWLAVGASSYALASEEAARTGAPSPAASSSPPAPRPDPTPRAPRPRPTPTTIPVRAYVPPPLPAAPRFVAPTTSTTTPPAPLVAIPDVVGEPVARAVAELEALGFNAYAAPTPDCRSTSPGGGLLVESEFPGAGTRVVRGIEVDLATSEFCPA